MRRFIFNQIEKVVQTTYMICTTFLHSITQPHMVIKPFDERA